MPRANNRKPRWLLRQRRAAEMRVVRCNSLSNNNVNKRPSSNRLNGRLNNRHYNNNDALRNKHSKSNVVLRSKHRVRA